MLSLRFHLLQWEAMLFGIWCLASAIWRVCDVVFHYSRALLDTSFKSDVHTFDDEAGFRVTTAHCLSEWLEFAYEYGSEEYLLTQILQATEIHASQHLESCISWEDRMWIGAANVKLL